MGGGRVHRTTARQKAAAADAPSSDSEQVSAKPEIRILIVDDHPIVRLGIRTMLAGTPDMVLCGEAESAEAALESMPTCKPDVVIVDLSLGKMSGLELIRELRKANPLLPTIVLSMHDEALFAKRALSSGARGYVMKSEAVGSLVDAIREVRAGRIYVSPRVSQQVLERLNLGALGPRQHWLETLTDRELEVFELIGRGVSTAEIAERMHVSVKTVETHRSNIKAKLNVEDSNALIRLAVSWIEHP
jgi:DNA-binding NarL/FixJ family response regulator